ncbi:Holliday junction branch migration protein RuvA [Aminicella lysinilytica]|uniref:Holliday junction branch migration complex subunit RuvA n=1 Tax=Aminicella lysinilytica TaxID=433323 RepID=A0A4R6PXD6_9FIRM|nr:Holliday junction branch migration protein RuvA [Aminicella lysinilytica]TDP50811.1 Holliday junction DNA helicase subunit RuvA [Aminicella lysinilytica]
MIRFIKGKFHPLTDGTAVIESASGVGFLVYLPANSPLYKNLEGDEVKVFTAMIVKEDDVSLYGFDGKEELDLFKLLITVNGVGAKAAMAIMSILPAMELRRAIAGGDVEAIKAASGVGKKTAERVILELKDKVGDFGDLSSVSSGEQSFSFGSERTEAVSALITLGYSKSEAETAVGRVIDDELPCEEYIKRALKI